LFDFSPSADLQPAAHPTQAIGLLRGPFFAAYLARERRGGDRAEYSLASEVQHFGINDPFGACILWPAFSLHLYLGRFGIRSRGRLPRTPPYPLVVTRSRRRRIAIPGTNTKTHTTGKSIPPDRLFTQLDEQQDAAGYRDESFFHFDI
jgi:hypothetical protein